MKFFMYANGMPFDGDTIPKHKKSLGGSETMAFLAARELAARGHSVFVFSNIQHVALIDGVHYLPIGEVNQQKAPFGFNFEAHALNIPHDVLLIQRLPGIFSKPYNSKLNYFWAHDLALKRYQPHMNSMIWNVDRYLTVSEYHKQQTLDVYKFSKDIVHPLPNGIDLDMWKGSINPDAKIRSKTMLYGARPERGLVNLVKEGGIMEKILAYDPEIKLLVCSYENSHPSMTGMYKYLYDRCNVLPNVQNIGYQSQQALAQIEKNCWLYVYPTEFEDTSCLMVMQNAAAGTPFVSCKAGALEETGVGSGVYWSSIETFDKAIKYIAENPSKWRQLHKKSLEKAEHYSIKRTVDILDGMIDEDFKKFTSNGQKLYDHFVHTSEIFGADKLIESSDDSIIRSKERDRYCTDIDTLNETQEFYDKTADRNFELGNKHGMNNINGLLNMGRLQPVIERLSTIPQDSTVLDYGCCVGQLSFALKTKFPHMKFVGVDISMEQLDVGIKYAEDNKIENVTFKHCTSPAQLVEEHYDSKKSFDAILCLEVLEHIWDHKTFLEDLSKLLKKDGVFILSTPLGPFEDNSEDPDPLYQHLHNFEEDDIDDIAGKKKDFSIVYVSERDSRRGEKLGNYIWSWIEDETTEFGEINWERKFKQQRPIDQVSCCMIIKPDGNTLRRTLLSIQDLSDEIIIGVDDPDWKQEFNPDDYQLYVKSSDKLAYTIGKEFGVKFIPIESPLKQGFAEARNKTVELATKDWILWLDDDETFVYTNRFSRFLRDNSFESYSINHHHITAEPLGILKTDHPSRVFRNNKGMQFYGIVHEHPETGINEGPGRTFVVPDELGKIMHYGYETEEIRRKRFVRNYPLMQKDRELNPERKLGKFLWIRDLAHMNRFIMERNGGHLTDEVVKNAKDAIAIWRSELETTNIRMVHDSLQYITECVRWITNNQGINFRMSLDINNKGLGDILNNPMSPIFYGMVENEDDLSRLQKILLRDKLNFAETSQVYI